MKIKFSLIFCLLVGISSGSLAQWFTGFQGGASENSLLTNISNRIGQAYKPGFGLYLNLPLQYQKKLWKSRDPKDSVHYSGLTLGTGLIFMQKAYSLDRTDTTLTLLDQRTRNDYFKIPLDIGFYHTAKKITFTISGGMYAAYWLDGHIQGAFSNLLNTAAPNPQAFNYNEKYTFDSRRDNRFEWGWTAGAGARYATGDGSSICIGVQFYQSLSDQQKQYMLDQVPRYNRAFAYTFGTIKNLKW